MSALMNPEAKEFVPENVDTSCQSALVAMSGTISRANKVPKAYRKHRGHPNATTVVQDFTQDAVLSLTKIIQLELTSLVLQVDKTEFIMERVIDANDKILDRMYRNIECLEKGIEPTSLASAALGGLSSPVVTSIKIGKKTLTSGKNIILPQLFFKDKVDNSPSIFAPKITHKPNSIKPLSLELCYDESGEAVGYKHPYAPEIAACSPMDEWLEPDAGEIPFPKPIEETPLTYIDTEAQMDVFMDHLRSVDEIAVDLEHHSVRTFQGFTCLIQMTTVAGDFIIDTFALRHYLHVLNEVFTDPTKLKLFHGADNDIIWLQRDFGVYVVNLFDTHQAAIALSLPKRSLAALLGRYCQIVTDKNNQLSDWRIRPLPPKMIEYARTDTHYLSYIWRRMRAELVSKGAGKLQHVFTASKQVCLRTYRKPTLQENGYLALYKNKKKLNWQQVTALKMLYRWRFEEGRERDENPLFLLPDTILLALAEALPRDVEGICSVCSPLTPFIKQNLTAIHKTIAYCRGLPRPSEESSNTGSTILSSRASTKVPILTDKLYCTIHDRYDDKGITAQDHFLEQLAAKEEATEDVCSVPIFIEKETDLESSRKRKLASNWDNVLSPYERFKYYFTYYIQDQEPKKEDAKAKIPTDTQKNNEIEKQDEQVIFKKPAPPKDVKKMTVSKEKQPEVAYDAKNKGKKNKKFRKHTIDHRQMSAEVTKKNIDRCHTSNVKSRGAINSEASTSRLNPNRNPNPYRYGAANYLKYYDGGVKKHKRA